MVSQPAGILNGLVIRVDDRLIHGQILYGWALNWANEVWLANDRVAGDPAERQLYEEQLARIETGGVISVDEAIERYGSDPERCVRSRGRGRCLLVLGNCRDLKRLIDGGARPVEVHLANLGEEEDRIHVAETVNLTRDDCRILNELKEEGYAVCLRKLPQSKTKEVKIPE